MNAIISRHPKASGYQTIFNSNQNTVVYLNDQWNVVSMPPTQVESFVYALVRVNGELKLYDCSHGCDRHKMPLIRFECSDKMDHPNFPTAIGDHLVDSVVNPNFEPTIQDLPPIEPYAQCGEHYALGSAEYAEQNGFETFNRGAIHHCIEITQGVETVTLNLWDGSQIVIGLYGDTNRLPRQVRFADMRTKNFTGEVTVNGSKVKPTT